MKKTLLKKITIKDAQETEMFDPDRHENVKLSDLIIEMNDVLKEAASDLLQPRTQSVKNILKKALR